MSSRDEALSDTTPLYDPTVEGLKDVRTFREELQRLAETDLPAANMAKKLLREQEAAERRGEL